MKNPRLILEEVYQNAHVERNMLSMLSPTKREWVKVVVAGAESQKAVLTVLVTSLVKKIEMPSQDIRYHKVELPNGYSGRSFDTEYVTSVYSREILKTGDEGKRLAHTFARASSCFHIGFSRKDSEHLCEERFSTHLE